MSRKRDPSPVFRQALDRIAQLRDEHRSITLHAYMQAEEAVSGAMLNDRGRRAGIDPYALFTHNTTFMRAYASEELIEHLAAHPRLTFEQYEYLMTETEPF